MSQQFPLRLPTAPTGLANLLAWLDVARGFKLTVLLGAEHPHKKMWAA